jgi:hypothetical protein
MTKIVRVTFQLELDIAYPDHLSDDEVSEQYLDSDRFSISHFDGEPGTVLAASSGIQEVKSVTRLSPLSARLAIDSQNFPVSLRQRVVRAWTKLWYDKPTYNRD